MAKFSVLGEPKTYEYVIDSFLGLDTQTDFIDIDKNRSPDCVNLIRDYKGSIRKRYGYQTQETFPKRINGVHLLMAEPKKRLIHAGEKYYHRPEPTAENPTPAIQELYTSGDQFSVSQQLDGKLYLVDGTNYLIYDGKTMQKPEGRIPVIIIDRNPTGGGTPLEQINLLQPKRTEKFKGDGTSKDFQLTTANLDATPVTIQRLEADGTLANLEETTDFTVNRELGKVTFLSPPPTTPSAGEDNLYITYAKTVPGYAEKINHCTMSTVYGMNGAFDRIILTGNPEFKNYDWFSKSNDFSYFGDLDYSIVGQDNAAIINYAVENGNLITLKNNSDNLVNSVIRRFEMMDNDIVLRAAGSMQAIGALSKYSFAYVETEPMYITVDKKVAAITVADNRLERFSQGRSYYIDKSLASLDLSESYAVNYNGFYVFTAGEDLYLLDGLQASFQRNTPYSHRQYEAFFFSKIGARILWVEDGELWFGTSDGIIKKFVKDTYNDDGVPVVAKWETPAIFTDYWHMIKTFRHLYILLRSELRTGIKVDAMIEGIWEEVVAYDQYWHYFDFNDIDFSAFTFNTDQSEKAAGTKIQIKKVQQIRLRFINSREEPLSISKIGLTFNLLRNVK